MKKFLLTLLIVSLMSVTVFAKVSQDSVLLVPKTNVAPVIDGELDSLGWRMVQEALVVKPDIGDGVEPIDWFDNFGSLRMMYDDENLYIFLMCHDDFYVTGANHEYDGVELYFDADNSKIFEAYDGFDDLQLRFNLGETTVDEIDTGYGGAEDWGFDKTTIEHVVVETMFGWNLECAIPIAELQLMEGYEFGFDVQTNDADEETRETMLRWWATDNNEWHHAHLFGTAKLENTRTVEDVLEIPKAAVVPTVDGAMGDGEWADAVAISVDHLDTTQANFDFMFENIWGWEDVRANNWLKHDGENLWFFLQVRDDVYDLAPDESANWEFDSIEIFFDGDNSDTSPYDGIDDIQTRLNLGQEGAESIDAGYGQGDDWAWFKEDVEYVVVETEIGWNAEAKWPLADLFILPNEVFGYELQLNDVDDGSRNVWRWWAPSEPTWRDASLFGSAMLVDANYYGTDVKEDVAAVESYALSQNYPNPFNPTTTIEFAVPQTGNVQLVVYDMLGKEIATLVNDVRTAGQYSVTFDGANLASGVYFYTLRAGDITETQKMMLVK